MESASPTAASRQRPTPPPAPTLEPPGTRSAMGRLLRSRAVLAVVAALLSAAAASVVTAGASDDPNVIHGCAADRTGALRIVSDPTECTIRETPVSWNQQGERGPQGDPGISPAAGTSCPAGEFVTGIATDGTLVCAAVSTDDGGSGGGGGTDPINCDDGDPATVDSYDSETGSCTHTPINCDDGDPSTVDYVVDGTCVHEPSADYDGDGDGYAVGEDCDDTNASVNPGAVEDSTDGVDNNCDGTVDETTDLDNDGFAAPEDCNDSDPTIYPGAYEHTAGDGIDSNCNGDDNS